MIYRFNLPVTDYQEIDDRKVISVAACRSGRSDQIDLWCETGYLEGAKQGIYIFGTGHPQPWDADPKHWGYFQHRDNFRFVGTVVTPSGLVWHVYTGPLRPKEG